MGSDEVFIYSLLKESNIITTVFCNPEPRCKTFHPKLLDVYCFLYLVSFVAVITSGAKQSAVFHWPERAIV